MVLFFCGAMGMIPNLGISPVILFRWFLSSVKMGVSFRILNHDYGHRWV